MAKEARGVFRYSRHQASKYVLMDDPIFFIHFSNFSHRLIRQVAKPGRGILLDLYFSRLVGNTSTIVETLRIRLSIRFLVEASHFTSLPTSSPIREHKHGPQMGYSRMGNMGNMWLTPGYKWSGPINNHRQIMSITRFHPPTDYIDN